MHRTGRIVGTIPVVAAVAIGLAMSASPIRAVDDNAPNVAIGGYGVHASASVLCDPANRSMTVTATASTMQASGFLGGITAGPYDNGQLVTYNVWARETTAAAWTQVYSWSPWQAIRSMFATADGALLVIPRDLGTNLVYGIAGHDYEVVIQISWWTGQANTANVTPTYFQSYRTDAFNTYIFNPTHCVF